MVVKPDRSRGITMLQYVRVTLLHRPYAANFRVRIVTLPRTVCVSTRFNHFPILSFRMKRFFSIVIATTAFSYVQADNSLIGPNDTAANSLPGLESQHENSTYLSETSNSGSDNKAENCLDACPDNYAPVIDENGKTYANACLMRVAKCKDTKKDVGGLSDANCPKSCPNNYAPVVDENGKTYTNECFMRIAKC